MTLADLWFLVIAFLFTGYFVLEGFDFGVGVLMPALGRDDTARRVMINTIGPVWDANETWLIVAGGAMFAAFPYWYASLFSGFYLPLLIILLALIVRGVAFEYRGKRDGVRWRRRWDACIVAGSALPALLWGVVIAATVAGVPLDADGNVTGSPLALLTPYAVLGGVSFLALFTMHGAVFLALRTTGGIRHEASALAGRLGMLAAALGTVFLLWTAVGEDSLLVRLAAGVAVVALLVALHANRAEREGRAFAATATAVALTSVALFAGLHPEVLPSTTDPAWSLTVQNASSTPETLLLMTWIAAPVLPIVLAYQFWSYRVFRARIGRRSIPAPAPGQHGRA